MIRRPPRSTRTDTRFPYTTLFRSPQGRWFPQFCCRKIGTPIAAGAAATRSLTRFTPYRAPPSVFHMTEEIMTVEQHIEELRAELRCITDPVELRQIEAELQRSEEHTSELQSLMRISYAVFCLKKKNKTNQINSNRTQNTH